MTPDLRASGSTATADTPCSATRSSAASAQSSALSRLRSLFAADFFIPRVYPYAWVRDSIFHAVALTSLDRDIHTGPYGLCCKPAGRQVHTGFHQPMASRALAETVP